jgi:hypothetical protein
VPLVVGVTGGHHQSAEIRETVRAAFERILGELRAAYPHTPLLVLSTETPEGDDPTLEAARAQQISIAQERTLARVSHFSDILVVFSDPASPADRAEASAVVALRETGRSAEHRRLLEPPEVATTYHVAVRGDGATEVPLEVRRIYPHRFKDDRRSAADFDAALTRLDRFNADIAPIEVPAAGLLPSERLFTAVDTAANSLQRRLFFWQRALYTIAFVAAATQIAGGNIGPWGSYLKVIAVALTLLAYLVVRRSDYQNRYQDYRALGEGLRVQSAWTHAGVADSVDTSYLRMQQTELLWIRSALRTVGFLQSAGQDGTRNITAVRVWVEEQRRYFQNASAVQNRRKVRFGRIVNILAPLNLGAGLLLLAGLSLPPSWYGGWLSSIEFHRDAVKYAAGVFAGLAALVIAIVTSYMRTRAFSENANRYQRMFLIFDEAHRLLAESPEPDPAAQRELARELGREALAEHAEWLLSQRERPVSVVYTSAA